jgi:hypothetical protein
MTPMWFTMDERLIPDRVNCLIIDFAPDAATTAQQLADCLAAGNPSIRCVVEGTALVVVAETLREGDEAVIAERIWQADAS